MFGWFFFTNTINQLSTISPAQNGRALIELGSLFSLIFHELGKLFSEAPEPQLFLFGLLANTKSKTRFLWVFFHLFRFEVHMMPRNFTPVSLLAVLALLHGNKLSYSWPFRALVVAVVVVVGVVGAVVAPLLLLAVQLGAAELRSCLALLCTTTSVGRCSCCCSCLS